MIFAAQSLLRFGCRLFPRNPFGNDQQIAFVERILTSVTLHFAARRFWNTVSANQYNSIRRQIVFFGDAGANRVDHRIEIAALTAPFHFTNNHQVFAVPAIDCETGSTTGACPRMALFNGRFDILRISIDTAHDNHVFQTAGDKEFTVMHETKIPRSHIILAVVRSDPAIERRRGFLRPIPVSGSSTWAIDQNLANVVVLKRLKRFRIDDQNHFILANLPATHQKFGVLVIGFARHNAVLNQFIFLKASDDRLPTGLTTSNQQSRLGHTVTRVERLVAEAIRCKTLSKQIHDV